MPSKVRKHRHPSKNYDRSGETRACQNIECLRPLAPWQMMACCISCRRAAMKQKAYIDFTCEVCGKVFQGLASQHASHAKLGITYGKYCGTECAIIGRSKPKVYASRLCLGCNRAIDLDEPGKPSDRVYHNRECMAQAYNGKPRGKKGPTAPSPPKGHTLDGNLNDAFTNMEGFVL